MPKKKVGFNKQMTMLSLVYADPKGHIKKNGIKFFLHSSGMIFKVCSECGIPKTLDEYYVSRGVKIRGVRAECKKCGIIKSRKRYCKEDK